MPQCIWDRTACKSKIAEGQRCLLLSSAVPCQPGLTCVDDPNSTVSSNGICKKPVTPTPTKKTTPTPKAQPNTCAADSGYQCNQLSNAALKCPDGRVDCKSGLKCVDASGNSVSGTTKTGTCKATTSDPKPTSTPVPGGGGGGGTIPQDSQCTNIGGTCTNVGTAQQCPDVSKPRLLIGYCPSSPSTSIRCCAPATGGGGGGGGNITPSVTPTPTTGGGTGTTGNAVLNFKLKLQGVNSYPKGSKTVAFKVKLQGPTNTDYQSGLLTVDQNLIWSGSTTFSNIVVGPSTKYTVFVKVGKHLQKRVCAFAPSETSGGTYNCSESNMPITAGTNNLDFSGILMLVGDLPSSTGEQNGVVDSYDISYVLNHLGSTVESELGIGDLNFDGVIDTQDRSLIIQSLNVKYDDQ